MSVWELRAWIMYMLFIIKLNGNPSKLGAIAAGLFLLASAGCFIMFALEESKK